MAWFQLYFTICSASGNIGLTGVTVWLQAATMQDMLVSLIVEDVYGCQTQGNRRKSWWASTPTDSLQDLILDHLWRFMLIMLFCYDVTDKGSNGTSDITFPWLYKVCLSHTLNWTSDLHHLLFIDIMIKNFMHI